MTTTDLLPTEVPAIDIVNASGYRFVNIDRPDELQAMLRPCLQSSGVKGAVILAHEGINVTIAGTRQQLNKAVSCFQSQPFTQDLWLKETISTFVPHKRLRVRVRTEIIAFDGVESIDKQASRPESAALSPATLDAWLEQGRPLSLLDTRNDYEVVSGTFAQAKHLDIKHFRHFKQAVKDALQRGELDKSQPLVTFCTGGIRCEKAAPWLLEEGFAEVYQIEGGILHYLQNTQARYWQGDCFVFDDRVELNPQLEPTGAGLCDHCQLAVPAGTHCQCQLGPHFHATCPKK